MPDTLTPLTDEELADVRAVVGREAVFADPETYWHDMARLVATIDRNLAHIDALTEAVRQLVAAGARHGEWLHPFGVCNKGDGCHCGLSALDNAHAAVLAILRGETANPRLIEPNFADDPVVREAQVYGGDDRARHVAQERQHG